MASTSVDRAEVPMRSSVIPSPKPDVYVPRVVQTSPRKAVYELYEIMPGPAWQAGEARVSRVVLIGRNLRPAAVKQSWADYVDSPKS